MRVFGLNIFGRTEMLLLLNVGAVVRRISPLGQKEIRKLLRRWRCDISEWRMCPADQIGKISWNWTVWSVTRCGTSVGSWVCSGREGVKGKGSRLEEKPANLPSQTAEHGCFWNEAMLKWTFLRSSALRKLEIGGELTLAHKSSSLLCLFKGGRQRVPSDSITLTTTLSQPFPLIRD